MTLDIRLLESHATRVFASDQRRLLWLQQGFWDDIKRELGAKAIQLQPSDRPTVVFHLASLSMSKERTIQVKSASVTNVELAVTVIGHTPDAIDAVTELWSKLGDAAEEQGEFDSEPGDWNYRTTAVVHSKELLPRMFPGIAVVQSAIRSSSQKLSLEPQAPFRIDVIASGAAHGLPTAPSFVIEPRVAAKPEDHVYFTQSPLPSDEHLRLLETLCGMR